MFFILRILIGLVFVVSGLEKLISPYQNFLYVIQAYQVLPGWAEELTARLFPWAEFLAGLFALLGLWTAPALLAVMVMTAGFITIVGQALLRGLPIDQCGCFGELVHVPPQSIIVFDSLMLLLIVALLRYLPQTTRVSLDQSFKQ